jgi:hypothetical protein
LINITQQGRERFCEVQPKKLAEVADWLEPFRQMWDDRFNRLDQVLTQMKKKEPSAKPTEQLSIF